MVLSFINRAQCGSSSNNTMVTIATIVILSPRDGFVIWKVTSHINKKGCQDLQYVPHKPMCCLLWQSGLYMKQSSTTYFSKGCTELIRSEDHVINHIYTYPAIKLMPGLINQILMSQFNDGECFIHGNFLNRYFIAKLQNKLNNLL